MTGTAAIAGLGITEVGKVYGRRAGDFGAEAVRLAVEDAGLAMQDLDGLLVNAGKSGGLDLSLAETLGLSDLSLCLQVNAFGASAIAMVQLAASAVMSGTATAVACVFADSPLREGKSAGEAYRRPATTGYSSLLAGSGITSTTSYYALAAQRHMARFGTTSQQLGAVAVSQRAWAQHNPIAQMRTPLTIEEHQNSRWVVEPLHLLDCCLVSNGGVAIVVTSAERAAAAAAASRATCGGGVRDTRAIHGNEEASSACRRGAVQSGRAAHEDGGHQAAAMSTIREIYDCYTFTMLVTLEDYGFCAKGEGGELAASGALGPGGALPTNTGGGQLSSFYLWGMTPLSEAVIQARGQGDARQVEANDFVLRQRQRRDLAASLHAGRQFSPAGASMNPSIQESPDGPTSEVSVFRNDSSAAFFDGAAREALLVKQCTECGHLRAARRSVCRRCGSPEYAWRDAAGTGTLITWAVNAASPSSGRGVSQPFGLIELPEGPWLESLLVGAESKDLYEGAPFVLTFVRGPDGDVFPAFRPSPSPESDLE